MKINEVKRKGKSNYFYLVVDNNKYLISDESVVKYGLKNDDNITVQILQEIIDGDEKKIAFEKGIDYLARSLKTKWQVKKYLLEKGLSLEAVDQAIKKILEYGYINDEKYATVFVAENSKTRGKLWLKLSLKEKGVEPKIIESVLKSNINFAENAYEIAKKYAKNAVFDEKFKTKLFRFLISRGFSYDETLSAVKKVFNSDFDD